MALRENIKHDNIHTYSQMTLNKNLQRKPYKKLAYGTREILMKS